MKEKGGWIAVADIFNKIVRLALMWVTEMIPCLWEILMSFIYGIHELPEVFFLYPPFSHWAQDSHFSSVDHLELEYFSTLTERFLTLNQWFWLQVKPEWIAWAREQLTAVAQIWVRWTLNLLGLRPQAAKIRLSIRNLISFPCKGFLRIKWEVFLDNIWRGTKFCNEVMDRVIRG